MKESTVCSLQPGKANSSFTRQLTSEFLDSKRFSPDLRKEGNGIGDAYEYNKQPVEGYVYLDHYYLEKRGDDFATVLCTREVVGTFEEVENALLEYFLDCEGYHYGTVFNSPKSSVTVSMLNLDAHQEKISFYRALLVLESNVFEAFGPTPEEARSFLTRGLVNHAIGEDLDVEWFKPYLDYIQVKLVSFGDCLRTENI